VGRDGKPLARYAERGVPGAILEYDARHDLMLWSHASAEAQAAAIADDIAYDAHDIDDGLRAGLFALGDLRSVAFLAGLLDEIDSRWPGLHPSRAIHELGRRVITRFVEDVIREGERRLTALGAACADAVRLAPEPVLVFTPALAQADRDIKAFLFANMYRHPSVMRVRRDAEQVVRDLFGRFLDDPAAMPAEWRAPGRPRDRAHLARRVADYIAGMTDRYALQEHRRLFDATPELR
jgi:dGTPase